jgi:large subunit ribosomal protein L33
MSMAKKAGAIKVRLESSAGTGYRYYKKHNPRSEKKLELKKYDPWATHPETGKRGAHVVFTQKKMPPHKKN